MIQFLYGDLESPIVVALVLAENIVVLVLSSPGLVQDRFARVAATRSESPSVARDSQ